MEENIQTPQPIIAPPLSVPPVIQTPTQKPTVYLIFFTILFLAVLSIAGYFGYQNLPAVKVDRLIKNCLSRGGALGESYPPQCFTPTPTITTTLTPTSDTANWKTYVDSKYGFSFNLPGYYQTESKFWTTDEPVNYLNISPQPGSYEGCCFKKSDPISIRSKAILMESYQNIGINDWKSKSRFATSHKFIKENVFNENGLSFTKFTALGLGQTGFADDDRLTGFFIQKGTTLIVISVNHFSENQNEAELFIDQILSTFKFVEQKGTSTNANPTIDIPAPNSKITNPVKISGHIPRDWTWEANFLIEIQNQNHIPLGSTPVNVTFLNETDPIGSFSVSLNYVVAPETKNGYLIIKNDNASGLPENNKSFEIPVNF